MLIGARIVKELFGGQGIDGWCSWMLRSPMMTAGVVVEESDFQVLVNHD